MKLITWRLKPVRVFALLGGFALVVIGAPNVQAVSTGTLRVQGQA